MKFLSLSLNKLFAFYVVSLIVALAVHYYSLDYQSNQNSRYNTEHRFKDIYDNSKNLIHLRDNSLPEIIHNNPALHWHNYQLILENGENHHFYYKHKVKGSDQEINFDLPAQVLTSNKHEPFYYRVDDDKLVGWMKLQNNYRLVATIYHEPQLSLSYHSSEHTLVTNLIIWSPVIIAILFFLAVFSVYLQRGRLWQQVIDYSLKITQPNTSIHKFNNYQPLKFDSDTVGKEFQQLAQALNRANYQLYNKNMHVSNLVSRFKRLIGYSPLPIAFMNKHGELNFLNERFRYVFMVSLNKEQHLYITDILTANNRNAAKVLNNLPEQKLPCMIEVLHLLSDQTYQLNLMPLFSNYGQLQGFTLILNNITPLNNTLSDNTQLINKQADQLADFERLWSVMGHELRTPLSGIIGMLELLNTNNLNLEQKEAFETLENTSQAMLFMLNDMLDLAKLDAGKLQLNLKKTDILELCRSVCGLMVGNARRKKIDLLFYFDLDAVRFIKTDHARLRQILLNLIGNAIKFTESGYVALVVSMQSKETNRSFNSITVDDDRYTMLFEVIDTGIGISDVEQAKLFSFFNQANSNISSKFGGSGLGLAISRNFSHLLGGEVSVESETGIGSNFQLQLPVIKDYKQDIYSFNADVSKLYLVILTKHELSKTYLHKICDYLNLTHTIQVVNLEYNGINQNHIQAINKELSLHKQTDMSPILLVEHGILRHEFSNSDDISLNNSQIANIDGYKHFAKILVSIYAERNINPQLLEQFDSYLTKPLEINYFVSELVRLSQRDDNNLKVSKLQHSFNEFLTSLGDDTNDSQTTETNKVTASRTNQPAPELVPAVKSTILVAEDNPINRTVITKILDKMGYPHIVVNNGEEAIQTLTAHRDSIAMILMDCRMPVLDGLEATKRIRENLDSIPIIALTANDTDQDKNDCLLAGMDNFMAKPIKKEALQEMFNKYSIR